MGEGARPVTSEEYARLPMHVRMGLFAHWLYGFVPGGELVREVIRAIEPGVRALWEEYES